MRTSIQDDLKGIKRSRAGAGHGSTPLLAHFLIVLFLFTLASSVSFAAITPTYNGQTATIKNGATTLGTIQLMNVLVGGKFTDCDLFDCSVYLTLTPQATYTFSSTDKALGKIGVSTKGKTSFIGAYYNESYNVTLTDDTYNYTPANDGNGSYMVQTKNGTITYNSLRYRWTALPDTLKVIGGQPYQIRLDYHKTDMKDNVDLVPSIFGTDLTQWAWWNSSCATYYPLTLTDDATPRTAELVFFPLGGLSCTNANCSDMFIVDNNATTIPWQYMNGTTQAVFRHTSGTGTASNTTVGVYASCSDSNHNTNFIDIFSKGMFETGEGYTANANLDNINGFGTCSKSNECTANTTKSWRDGTAASLHTGDNFNIQNVYTTSATSCYATFAGLKPAITASPGLFPLSTSGMTAAFRTYIEGGYNRWSIELQTSTYQASGISAGPNTWTVANLIINTDTDKVSGTVQNSTGSGGVWTDIAFAAARSNCGNFTLGTDGTTSGVYFDNVFIATVPINQYVNWTNVAIGSVQNLPFTLNNVTVQAWNLGTTNNVALIVNSSTGASCTYGATTNSSPSGDFCTVYLAANTLTSNGLFYSNQTATVSANWTINYTLTNASYLMNSTTSSTNLQQYFTKTDAITFALGSNISNYNITFTTPTDATVDGGQNYVGYGNITARFYTHQHIINGSVQNTWTENTTGTQTGARNDFNTTITFAANSTMLANVNFTWTATGATPTLGGSCTGSAWDLNTGAYTGSLAAAGTTSNLVVTGYGDCVTDNAFSAFALDSATSTYSNASQTINSSAIWVSLWSGALTNVAWTKTAEGTACWTAPGAQTLSGTSTIATGGGTTIRAAQTGDCITEGSFASPVLSLGYTNASQTIQSNDTVTNGDTDFYFPSLAWAKASKATCWATPGTQQLSGTFVLGKNASQVLTANQTGDCIHGDSNFSAFTVSGTPTEASQALQSYDLLTNLDTSYTFSNLAWNKAVEGTACWTGTSQLSGTFTLATTANLLANTTGDCITDNSWGGYALQAGYTNTSQTIMNTRIPANQDNYAFNGVIWSVAAEGSSCWTAPGDQQLSGTYDLPASGTQTLYANQTGSCILGTSNFSAYSVLAGFTNASQTIQSYDLLTSGDTDFYFGSLNWANAAQGDVCWTSGIQQLSGSFILGKNASKTLYANQTGQCAPNTFSTTAPLHTYYERADTGANLSIAYGASTTPTTMMPIDHYALDVINSASGALISTITSSNGLATSYSYNDSSIIAGLYKIRARAYDNFSISTDSNSTEFSLYNYTYGVSPIYETAPTYHNIAWVVLTGHTSSGAFLNWSGVPNASAGGAYTFQPLLEVTNDTTHYFNWIVNDSTTVSESSNHSQNVIWAYAPIAVQFPSQMMENTNYTANLTLFNPLNLATLAGDVYLNTTKWLVYAGTTTRYSNVSVLTPTLAGSSASLSTNGSLNITFGGATMNRTIAGSNSTVFQFTLANCTNSSYAINFSQYDELTNASLNFSVFNAVVNLYTDNPSFYRSFTFNLQNVSSAGFCITPQNVSANSSWIITYQASGYPARGLSETYLNLQSPSSNLNISLLNVNGSYYQFYIENIYGIPIQNAHIESYRNGVLTQSAMTNPDGSAVLLFQPLFPYIVNASANGYISNDFNYTPPTIATVPMVIKLESQSSANVNNSVFSNITYSLATNPYLNNSYTNNSFIIQFNISDTTSSLMGWGMNITRTEYNGTSTLVYSNTSAIAAGGSMNYTATAIGRYTAVGWWNSSVYGYYSDPYVWTLVNGTSGWQLAQAAMSGQLSGWSWLFITLVCMMVAVGAAAVFTQGSGPAMVGLGVMWIFTLFQPSGMIFTPITMMMAASVTTVVVLISMLVESPW